MTGFQWLVVIVLGVPLLLFLAALVGLITYHRNPPKDPPA